MLTAKYPPTVLTLLLFGCTTEPARGDCADDCRRYTVSLTVVTEDWTGDAQDTAAVLDELVNNLNLAFRTPAGSSQGSKRVMISSAKGERGTSTRSSTWKGKPANQASPVR